MSLMMDAAFLGLLYSPPAYADSDVNTYITAVERADGGGTGSTPVMLESNVRDAIDTFVTTMKSNSIWTPATNILIPSGARTLAGALVPLKGPNPTNVGFTAGDYSRSEGLLGDGTAKYLNTNYDWQNVGRDSTHIGVYFGATGSIGTGSQVAGLRQASAACGVQLQVNIGPATDTNTRINVGTNNIVTWTGAPGTERRFFCSQRTGASATNTVYGTQTSSGSLTSFARVGSINVWAFGRNDLAAAPTFFNGRICYYTFGNSTTLSTYETAVQTLMAVYATLT